MLRLCSSHMDVSLWRLLFPTPPLHCVFVWDSPSWHKRQPTRWYTVAVRCGAVRLPDLLRDRVLLVPAISGDVLSSSSSSACVQQREQHGIRLKMFIFLSNSMSTKGFNAALDHAINVKSLYILVGCANLGSTKVRVNKGYQQIINKAVINMSTLALPRDSLMILRIFWLAVLPLETAIEARTNEASLWVELAWTCR